MKFSPCPESYTYCYFLCIHNIHSEDDNFHLPRHSSIVKWQKPENGYYTSHTGQNLKIGIKIQYIPCILFYTSEVSKSYGSLIFICSAYVRSGFRLVSTYKPHLSSNNYCNTFMIHRFLRQQLNLYTVSSSFRHQCPCILVFLLTLTILDGQDYQETVRNLNDVLVTLEKLECYYA